MAPAESEPIRLDELAGHAAQVRVAVIGGGVAGLVAALECAKVGTRVTVFEASDRVGGAARTVELDGLPVDLGVDTLPASLDSRLRDLGLGDALVVPDTETRWVAGLPGTDAAPLPDESVLGIPENMFSDRCRRILGTGGAWRAYVDRLRPPMTIGHERDLAKLVRTRMGQKVLDRLVAPISVGVFGVAPDEIDVDIAAPGLNQALTRTGSLSGAVATLREQAAPRRGLAGGVGLLVDALADRLESLGARVRCGTEVTGLVRDGDVWVVETASGDTPDAPPTSAVAGATGDVEAAAAEEVGAADVADAAEDAEGTHAVFDAVIVACDEESARRLLGVVAPAVAGDAAGTFLETVALVVDAPDLDGAPRGAEVLTAPGSHRARNVLHLTAKWGWLGHRAGKGRHVLRVGFDAAALAGVSDAEAVEIALAEASALLGVALDPDRVRAWHRARLTLAPPRAVRGRQALAESARGAIEALPTLAATGSWLSGSGLAQVIPDAVATADRLRRRALFP